MTTVSLNFRQAAYAPETGFFPICLITIDHASLAEPIRLSTDPTARIEEHTTSTDVVYGTVSREETFLFFPIRIKLPDDTDSGMGQITLEIDNVHRVYTETIRSIYTPPVVKVEVVMSNTLDTVEVQWPQFYLTEIMYNASVISGVLRADMLEKEPFPAGTFSPAYFPGVFG